MLKQKSVTFEERQSKCQKLIETYPNFVVVICNKLNKSQLPTLERAKFLIDKNKKMYDFIQILRKKLKISPEESLCIFLKGKFLLKANDSFAKNYNKYKDPDGFLYLEYTEMATFG